MKIQNKNFQNTVKSWEIQDKNPENNICMKNENIPYIKVSY